MLKAAKRECIPSVDAYIARYPLDIQQILMTIRKTIIEAAPQAVEKISWQMPTYTFNGNLVHFAVHKKHIGFYPGPSVVIFFKDRLMEYKCTKGAIQFPLNRPVPYALIKEIVEFRVQENMKK